MTPDAPWRPPGGGAPQGRPPFPLGWLALTLVAFLAALLAGDVLVYRRLVLPRLPDAGAAPAAWWLGVVGPALAVMLLSGARLRAWRHAVAFAWAASALSVAVEYVRVTAGGPGTASQHPAASAPLFFWVVGLVIRWVAFGLVFGAGMLLGALVRRRPWSRPE